MSKKKSATKKKDANNLEVRAQPDEDFSVSVARTALRPTVQAAVTLKEYGGKFGDLNLQGLIESLGEQTKSIQENDLARAEAMLISQAHTLDAIFNELSRRAIRSDYLSQLETYLKLGLRAQSQARATLQAISEIKNPLMVGYVGQANIAHGPQQVNNGSDAPEATSRAEEKSNPQNKLLEEKDGERLDTGTAGTTSRTDPALAPVGEVDGTEKHGR